MPFGGFSDDPSSRLAGIFTLAFMSLESLLYSSAFRSVLELEYATTGGTVARNCVTAGISLDNVHLGFICHVDSFPQVGSER
jgi:hypothetical protein